MTLYEAIRQYVALAHVTPAARVFGFDRETLLSYCAGMCKESTRRMIESRARHRLPEWILRCVTD